MRSEERFQNNLRDNLNQGDYGATEVSREQGGRTIRATKASRAGQQELKALQSNKSPEEIRADLFRQLDEQSNRKAKLPDRTGRADPHSKGPFYTNW